MFRIAAEELSPAVGCLAAMELTGEKISMQQPLIRRGGTRRSSQVADSRSGAAAAVGFSPTLVVGDKSRLKRATVAPPIKLEF